MQHNFDAYKVDLLMDFVTDLRRAIYKLSSQTGRGRELELCNV